ncbi:hypothetical protein [Pseudomonas veronii]
MLWQENVQDPSDFCHLQFKPADLSVHDLHLSERFALLQSRASAITKINQGIKYAEQSFSLVLAERIMFISKPLDHSGYTSRQKRSCPASMSCIEILECRAHLANEIIQRVSWPVRRFCRRPDKGVTFSKESAESRRS